MTTITVDRAVLEQALKAMDKATRFMSDSDYVRLNQAIDALRAALAQQEKEPEPPTQAGALHAMKTALWKQEVVAVEYGSPRRDWRGLSKEERDAVIRWAVDQEDTHFSRTVARAIEAALKEKNNG